MKVRLVSRVLLFLLALSGAVQVNAHGSVVAGADLCVINIGFYTAHFKIFQPQTSRNKEFCEDLPASGESVFVMEYLHKSLGEVPIEFRIIRNETGLGRFTRLADVQAISDLDAVTVFHRKPVIEKDVYTVSHVFESDGDYLGLVSVRYPDSQEQYMAVFPFHAGKADWGLAPLILGLALLAQLAFLFANGTLKRWYKNIMMMVPLLLLFSAVPDQAYAQSLLPSAHGIFKASMHSEVSPIPLNQIHSWIIHLETAAGKPVADAGLKLTGGMPLHNHGLPTEPMVTSYLGNGDYRVEGVRFHMQGAWVFALSISYMGQTDTVNIPLSL